MENFLKFFKESVSFIKNNGIEGCLIILYVVYFLGVIFDFLPQSEILNKDNLLIITVVTFLIKSFNKKNKNTEVHQEEDLNEQAKIRMGANDKISNSLLRLKQSTEAERAFIMEFHNGKQNSSKLDFIYVDMTFEEADDGLRYINSEYQNLNISLFKMPNYVYKNYSFVGSTKEMTSFDKKFAHRLYDDDITYCGLMLLKSGGNIIGILGVAYENKPEKTEEEIQLAMSLYAQDISGYLDLNKAQKI